MEKKDKKYILCTIENESFDYTFDGYSSFSDIEDEKFHELRLNYLKAKKELKEYLENGK